MVAAMAGQLLAEPSIRHQKERSFFPFFGEEERLRSFRSRIGSAQPTAGQPKAGKPEAARVGREGSDGVGPNSRRPAEERTGDAEQQAAGSEPNGRLHSNARERGKNGPASALLPWGAGGKEPVREQASIPAGKQSQTHERSDCIGLRP